MNPTPMLPALFLYWSHGLLAATSPECQEVLRGYSQDPVELAFLRDVLNNRQDMGLRQIFADKIDDRASLGGPLRAEFIRLQLTREATPSETPSDREQELILYFYPEHLPGVQFRTKGGFLWDVHFDMDAVPQTPSEQIALGTRLGEILRFEPLFTIATSGNEGPALQGPQGIALPPALKVATRFPGYLAAAFIPNLATIENLTVGPYLTEWWIDRQTDSDFPIGEEYLMVQSQWLQGITSERSYFLERMLVALSGHPRDTRLTRGLCDWLHCIFPPHTFLVNPLDSDLRREAVLRLLYEPQPFPPMLRDLVNDLTSAGPLCALLASKDGRPLRRNLLRPGNVEHLRKYGQEFPLPKWLIAPLSRLKWARNRPHLNFVYHGLGNAEDLRKVLHRLPRLSLTPSQWETLATGIGAAATRLQLQGEVQSTLNKNSVKANTPSAFRERLGAL